MDNLARVRRQWAGSFTSKNRDVVVLLAPARPSATQPLEAPRCHGDDKSVPPPELTVPHYES
jgi:hypothetical protein